MLGDKLYGDDYYKDLLDAKVPFTPRSAITTATMTDITSRST
jgi:hypothetical protein